MFQASVFDPDRDHVPTAQLQFPCLQHVSFEPTREGLVVNAFYATQQLFVKAYGNYLGIAQLGAFMAHEMEMKLTRMNVIVGVAKFERISKTDTQLAWYPPKWGINEKIGASCSSSSAVRKDGKELRKGEQTQQATLELGRSR